MANGINVDISVRDNDTGKYYRIPVLPEEIAYEGGDALKNTIQVIDLGNVDFANGVDLDVFGWSSFFPARYDAGYCTTSNLLTPLEHKKLFEGWKTASRSLQLICPAAGINVNMTLNSFKPTLTGFEGDIYYQVQFKERRVIRPVQVVLASKIPSKTKAGPESRNPVPAKGTPGTYIVKTGDTLTRIAKTLSLADWNTLYSKNKTLIGSDPNKLKPGQVLTV